MKLILFDFECPEHGVFEDLVKSSVRSVPCPQCKAPASRIISPVRIDRLGMATSDGATPTSIDYFEKVHRERKAIEEKTFAEHGDYGNHAGGDGGRPVSPEVATSLG